MPTAGDKIVLGVDLDEVVYRYTSGFRNWLEYRHGFTLPPEDPKSWSLKESGWFAQEEDFAKFHGQAVNEGLYEQLETLPQARETLWELSDAGYQLNIITSRFVNPGQHQRVVAQTVKALDRDRIPYSNLSFLGNKVLQQADAYLDDSPKNIKGLKEAGREVIIFTMAYNKALEGRRADTWGEARAHLRDLFGR